MSCRRVQITSDPLAAPTAELWAKTGLWPAHWIALPDTNPPLFAAYRRRFELAEAQKFRLHLSADERYELYLNGERVGRGPERGDEDGWFFDSYELDLPAGQHALVALVYSLGEGAPYAQMSVRHGFLACPEAESLQPLLATGVAAWEGKTLGGFEPISSLCAWGTGQNFRIHGDQFSWGFESGDGDDWIELPHNGAAIGGNSKPQSPQGEVGARLGAQPEIEAHHQLAPAMLPPMLDEPWRGFKVRHVSNTPRPTSEIPVRAADSLENEVEAWQALMNGENSLEIAPNSQKRVIVDLENYFCARPEVVTSGGKGSSVRVHWIEGLFERIDHEPGSWAKGNRDAIEGKFFTAHWNRVDGVGDEFLPDGGKNRRFEPLWWQAGRFVEIHVQTDDEPLTIEAFALRETRYPLEMESSFQASDESLEALVPIMVRVMQMCSHETYMDCPYYEQLMYVGDTRLEVLTTYALTRDDALPRKALRLFDWSRVRSGLTQSRYPSRVRQIIPPFSLWWVAMVHDYALWRGDAQFVRELLPGVRAVSDYFATLIGEDGLMSAPDGWNYSDWVKTSEEQLKYEGGDPKWRHGVPPDGTSGVSGVLNWQCALVFRLAGEVENWFGESEIGALQQRRAQNLSSAIDAKFWNEARGLYADDLAHQNWSEHAQCLAILSGFVPDEKREKLATTLFEAPDLARTTIYFSHYLFETCRVLNRPDKLLQRLSDWNVLLENGLKTTIEMPEPTRSDCHAWGAHPLFHYFATLAGIRPTAPGFSRVEVKPQLDGLEWIEATMPHPNGEIRVRVEGKETKVDLPEGVELAK